MDYLDNPERCRETQPSDRTSANNYGFWSAFTESAYSPHLDPIERLWGLMHRHVTHNRCHKTFADFKAAILSFLREEVPRKWDIYCDQATDNFRIISPKDFRVLS